MRETPPTAGPLGVLAIGGGVLAVVSTVFMFVTILREPADPAPVTVASPPSAAPAPDPLATAALGVTESAPPPVTISPAHDDLDRSIVAPDGFEVELVYAVPPEQGSWVSLAVDGAGRLITSNQGEGLYRVTPGRTAAATQVERFDVAFGAAQGLLWLEDDLYAVVNGGVAQGSGLYRLRDTDADDHYDEVQLLRSIPGRGGEHGPHGVVLGPDGLLYVVGGNHIQPPSPERSAVPRVWGEDHLLPRLWDARGHAVGLLAPGGWVCRTDRDGAAWELVSIGYRNPYDLAFNEAGELFTFDADMEWDIGAPWYRPTRVNHVTSGSEFGWRSGTGKWPAHYPDSLPAVVDIGPSSPTGIVFGYGSTFPSPYRDALFLLDWTFGTIYAVYLEPRGATYTATHEVFLSGRPLPLTDAVIHPDGAMYFTVGGRNTASAVYRVRYTGPARAAAALSADAGVDDRRRRHALERWHRADAPPEAVSEAWPALDDPDRYVRYAARTTLEHQPVERWRDRALTETAPSTRLQACIALARVGSEDDHDALVAALMDLDWAALSTSERLDWLRAWTLCFVRTGAPALATRRKLEARLRPHFPSGDEATDRELCDLLVYLESPVVVARTVALMEQPGAAPEVPAADLLARGDSYGQAILKMAAAPPQRQQVHYALALRCAERGWTTDLRERYFQWFESARQTSGGLSFGGFLDRIRQDALERVPEAERSRYEGGIGVTYADLLPARRPEGPGRAWTVDEVVALAAKGLEGRDFERGRDMYDATLCAACHRFAGRGLGGGPDLTGVGRRFVLRDLAEALVEPSRVISDQYAQQEFELNDDRIVIGRVVDQTEETLIVQPSMLAPEATVSVARSDIRSSRRSPISPMQPRLLDALSADEVLDLLAYLLAEGDPRSELFQGRSP